MRYAVAHVINSPAGAVRTARLVISDVPEKTSIADVMHALEAAGRAGEFSEAGIPFGNHQISAEGRRGWPAGIGGIDQAPAITWARLTTPPQRNEGRRITLRLTLAEYDRFALAARRADESLQAWFVGAAETRAAAGERLAAGPALQARAEARQARQGAEVVTS